MRDREIQAGPGRISARTVSEPVRLRQSGQRVDRERGASVAYGDRELGVNTGMGGDFDVALCTDGKGVVDEVCQYLA